MVGGGDCKVATVEVEASAASDNTATLPVTRPLNPQNAPPNSQDIAEKNNAANKEMELKNVRSTPAKKTSLFIIMSFIYAKLLVVMCIAYVISDVVTYRIPAYYYEGFFTYLYGVSILFLLYVFCFLLQESACCSRGVETPPPPPRPPKASKDAKDRDKKRKDKKDKDQKEKKKKETADVEAAVVTRKHKTTQNDQSHGSFFLRMGAIAFGLGTMVYNGLEFGTFFEVLPTSPCYQILKGVNPVLQMIFTFMQMYFIFMNSRLNIHRFKVIARFGLMHVVATNLCVWIRTLVLETLKDITVYHKTLGRKDIGLLSSIKDHTIHNADGILGLEPRDMGQLRRLPSYLTTMKPPTAIRAVKTTVASIGRVARTTARAVARAATTATTTTTEAWRTTSTTPSTTTSTTTTTAFPTMPTREPTTAATTFSTFLTTLTPARNNTWREMTTPSTTTTTTTVQTTITQFVAGLFDSPQSLSKNHIPHAYDMNSSLPNSSHNETVYWGSNFGIYAEALTANITKKISCERVSIMGTTVQDAAPYLYPFIIEYSLIGAAVIYVMWKHIGRHPRWPRQAEADLERRLEAMLSRRAVALAHAGHGRVDCVGASKGLFFGLLLLVGSLICLICFFVLIRNKGMSLLAIYLADASHCLLMALSIIAIIIGFIRVQSLKFKAEEQSDLNDILLRVSAFGLFIYAAFSVIAGALSALTYEPNLLVMVTGLLAVTQVVLQMLFISDVSRRRVHLPEHDRSKPGRQIVTFLLMCNVTMWVIYSFEAHKVNLNPVQLDFYGYLAWAIVQRITLPLCIFHRFHSAVTLAEIWKTSYKARLE
ncbi:proton channel OtopLc isoform X6 [Belonocnema kinseyi]|uniref:proton channel OtopLc isoform X6 n=1 Tax=Belonocnema kinseyi TaxID=2817044 RepID=UPI00143DF756|nr:proton channel OtopLc isoform X6 [Belonocnema kinseyi]